MVPNEQCCVLLTKGSRAIVLEVYELEKYEKHFEKNHFWIPHTRTLTNLRAYSFSPYLSLSLAHRKTSVMHHFIYSSNKKVFPKNKWIVVPLARTMDLLIKCMKYFQRRKKIRKKFRKKFIKSNVKRNEKCTDILISYSRMFAMQLWKKNIE